MKLQVQGESSDLKNSPSCTEFKLLVPFVKIMNKRCLRVLENMTKDILRANILFVSCETNKGEQIRAFIVDFCPRRRFLN